LYLLFSDLNSSLDYTEAELTIFYQPVAHNGWLAMLGVYFILGIIAIGLLVHLFGFHLYLSKYISPIVSIFIPTKYLTFSLQGELILPGPFQAILGIGL
jgi:hypothetical protein